MMEWAVRRKVDERPFADPQSAAEALAKDVAVRLRFGIAEHGHASLVVSGGKSPLPFFAALRKQRVDWPNVWITLADERWVDPTSPDSNEALLREHLLRDGVEAARFVGLKNAANTPEAGLAACGEALAQIPTPFDVVVLGMGADGHTASLFPAMDGLAEALDPAAVAGPVAAIAPVEPTARISLNLAALLNSRQIYLPIQGVTKRAVYHSARGGGISAKVRITEAFLQRQFPVAALFIQERVPVTVQIIDD
ncbi:6-phosphogluconolactonase [Panacagrimonas perspica]|uniref:6-phosphogluconolactonase n=1 Tax=Panacagrimonas perspica TaxID=381431 RepID=A0A4S3K7Z4_9GAMM|nr:6-phosphogluconolactonase [Panacagrimonas perspica]TDU31883.1 6-phosphogluconolactonase [Panacagrimonas perspica]THD04208.1 6-phosphogluconolactonase [Panacagrimonas perspica]